MDKKLEMKAINWRLDEDGFLRVTANILKEGVFPYDKDEVPSEMKDFTSSGSIMQFIPSDEFTYESISTLEGKPLIVNSHEWQTPENVDDKESFTVGSVAGTPEVDGDFIKCEFVVTDKKTIEAIMAKELSEVSAGYHSTAFKESGEYDGQHYDVVQRNLRFNHVLLVPKGMSGRCGHDVRILNTKPKEKEGEKPMEFKQTFGGKDFSFSTDEDMKSALAFADAKVVNAVEEAKKPASEEKAEKAAEEKQEEAEEKTENHEPEDVKDEMGEIKKSLEEAMKLIKEYESEEYAYAAAERVANEKAEAEKVMESEEADEETKKNCSNAKTMNAFRKAIIEHHIKKNGVEASESEHPTIWKLMVANAKKTSEFKSKNAVKEEKKEEPKKSLFPKLREVPVPQPTLNTEAEKHPIFKRPK